MSQFVVADAIVSIISSPLVTPFRIATGQHDELENVFLCLRTTDGVCGYGEAAVATHITGETIPGTLANLERIAAALKGCTVEDPEALCRELAPSLKGNHAALAALEMAILDITCRIQGIPLYQYFPPATDKGNKFTFNTDITIVIGSVEEARTATAQYSAQGFTTFKIKVGKDEAIDLERVLAVREIAPQSELILDANMGFNAARMLAFLDQLDQHGARPVLLEQPVPKYDWEGLSTITKALEGSETLVCADESVGSLSDAKRAIDTGAVSAINIKTMKSGLFEGAEIARLAARNNIPLMLGAMMESALSITASAHMAAGLGCIDYADLDTTFFIKGELSHSPYLDNTGKFELVGAAPGIGVEPKF
ncbi:dipeptide epimerase [Geomonas limicola]|uniref:Dipeptide epimerase n=1 Tax=Geomonas limicola TaxID=2740186 RepID=A0A6V8NGE3_9BACT|nr:dipeptide epimerase [Geomonas limicola]GFO70029.1 dipeptide epimerase [Geomonas limicola]